MISQKTVLKLTALLQRLLRRLPQTAPLWTWQEFRNALYEYGFDVHFLNYIEETYNRDPAAFLPLIHDGTIPAFVTRNDGWGQPVPNDEDRRAGQVMLAAMIAVVIPEAESIPNHVSGPLPSDLMIQLVASLREDGLDFVAGKIVPVTIKAVDIKKEDNYLIALIRSLSAPNIEVIEHHHDESEKAFVNSGWGAASAEARNCLVATLRGLRELASTRGGMPPFKQPGKDGPLIDDFRAIGFLTEEEKNAVMHVWVLLSHSGPHVGIKEQDSARLARLLAIGITEWVVLKFIAWEKNGYKPF